MRDSVAEMTNRIAYLKEANARLEAQLKEIKDEIAKSRGRHDSYNALLNKLREEKNTDSANWAFRVLQDFHLKADAANAVERLLEDAVRATLLAESEREMLDTLIDCVGEVSFTTEYGDVDAIAYLGEDEDMRRAWRLALADHIKRRTADGHHEAT